MMQCTYDDAEMHDVDKVKIMEKMHLEGVLELKLDFCDRKAYLIASLENFDRETNRWSQTQTGSSLLYLDSGDWICSLPS